MLTIKGDELLVRNEDGTLKEILAIKGDTGEQGPPGEQGPAGPKGDPTDISNLATKDELKTVNDGLANLSEEVDKKTEVFIAEYGVTTAQEILDAYNSGKLCYAKRNAMIFPITTVNSSQIYFGGSGIDASTVMYAVYVRISDSIWFASSLSADRTMETPQSWNVPTSKAVADYVAEKTKEPQFELIEEITIEEDVTQIERNANSNGEPYSYKKMMIVLSLNSCGISSAVYCDFYNLYGQRMSTANISSALHNSAKIYSEAGGEALTIGESRFFRSYALVGSGSSGYSCMKGETPISQKVSSNLVAKLVIRAISSGAVLKSGSLISIYGIRG